MENQELTAVLSYAPWVIFGIMAFLVLIGALKGLRRGIQRQTVRTATIILSIVLSVVAIKIGYGRIFSYLDAMTVEELVDKGIELGILSSSDDLSVLYNLEMATLEYVLAIPLTLILAPLVFVVLFIVISAIMLIVHAIVSGVLGFKKKKNNGVTRLCGMALGAVQGLLVSAMVLLPFVGLSDLAAGAMDTMRDNTSASETEQELVTAYDENVKPITECASMKIMGVCGGKIVYNIVATTSVEGESFNMRGEVDTVLAVYSDYSSLEGMEWHSLKPEDKAAIESMIDKIEKSDYFAPLLASVARSLSKTVTDGGMLDDVEEPMKTLFFDMFGIFATSTKDNFFTDVDTILDLYYLFSDEGILAAVVDTDDGGEITDTPSDGEETDIMKLLAKKDAAGDTVISRAISLLQDNPRTAPIVTSLMKLSLSMMVNTAGDDIAGDTGLTAEEIEEVYDNVKQGLNDVVQIKKEDYASDEAYKEAVSASLDETFRANDIELDADIIDVVADHVIENFGDVEEVTDEHIVEVVLEYYEAFLNGEFDDVIDPSDLQ